MIKVLIIDDEESVRRAVKKLGKWSEFGVEAIYECNNGAKGLDALREHRPDIVFVDMKMPIMNGGEFLEQAYKEKLTTEYIVISGFSDFEFTRLAMKVKVIDYLLKPLSGDDLNRALGNAIEQVLMRRNEAMQSLEKSIVSNMIQPLLKEKVYHELINNRENSILLKDYEKLINLRSMETYYATAVISILNFEQICTKRFLGDSFTFYFSMINIINEISNEHFVSFSMKNMIGKNQVVIILEEQRSNDLRTHKQQVLGMLNQCCEMLHNVFGVQAIAVAGDFHIGLSQLHISYDEATSALKNIDLRSDSKAVFNENTAITYTIKTYIENNYSEEIKLNDFATKYYLSKEHLCRIFKNEFGYGIYEYTLKVRMEKAKDMLKQRDIQIQSVAETLGYTDRNYFSRAFKKYFGYSPTEIKTREHGE